MKPETEQMLRNVASIDGGIRQEDLERAIRILRGDSDEVVQVMRRKEVMKLLGIHRRTLDYYLKRGYLDRVYGGGERAIGVSRESYVRFTKIRPAPGKRMPRKDRR